MPHPSRCVWCRNGSAPRRLIPARGAAHPGPSVSGPRRGGHTPHPPRPDYGFTSMPSVITSTMPSRVTVEVMRQVWDVAGAVHVQPAVPAAVFTLGAEVTPPQLSVRVTDVTPVAIGS